MYEIDDLIDSRYRVFAVRRGGMGLVFLCDDNEAEGTDSVGRIAAKTLLPELHKVPGASQRFYNEALLWVELGKHPNILQALYVKRIRGYPFIFMEYVEGHKNRGVDLASWIAGGALPVTVALNFAMQFCNGMIRAQRFFDSRGLRFAHRDIKPQNILVNSLLRVKITDFGLSKAVPNHARETADAAGIGAAQAGGDLSQAGILIGTPRYMAPELWRNSAAAGPASDIYAFGCVLHEMLTGAPLFRGSDVKALHAAHLKTIPPLPSTVARDVPPKLDRVAQRCLRKDPADRYADFALLMGDLSDVYKGLGGDVSRTHPGAAPEASDSVDALLNKSLSLFELGQKDAGTRLFARAIGHERRPAGPARRLVKAVLVDDPTGPAPTDDFPRGGGASPDDPTLMPADEAPTLLPSAVTTPPILTPPRDARPPSRPRTRSPNRDD